MHLRLPALALLPALFIAPALAAEGPDLRSDQCGIHTDYDVLVDSGGIWLRHGPQAPHEVVFHDGGLSLDGRMVTVSAADAARLRQMEAGARQLMPAATALAHEVSGVTFDALDAAFEAITGTSRNRQMRAMRGEMQDWIDASLGRGYWEQDAFGDGFDAHIEQMAETMAGSMTRSVLWQVFTGRAGAMERRADRLDAEVDRRMEARSQQLEAKAMALCPLVQSLAQAHDALEVRYQGQPLRLLERGESVRVEHGSGSGLHVSAGPDERPRGNVVAPSR
ncbi:TPA: DUF2884 family protein [Stenotrophomonas maltophilia]|uniref:DUF2884 family protein n=1 Tax=Stenotrophomonas maltophilia TaxID=40324 RepID=UPI000C14609D|nr:DUF2884 family protein [Stenotrophomonas maltophilia]MBN4991704.1 DUF2884 family protein [Stenotrophomonas maltophilia]MCI1152179.1 YggN family protein [Stenotrophomonas maltophilia]HDX0920988.1 DUF2884 family protein [Stenotrophomonas maltophilia]HEL3158502.1 DUF2884 family protein [Stenotrophomonas maltophilia]